MFRKVDELINKLITNDKALMTPSVKKIVNLIYFGLKTQTDAHIDVTWPQAVEFQNNLLSYLGLDYAETLNKAPREYFEFGTSLKDHLKSFNANDLESFDTNIG
jgi:hypothetical protein